MLKSLLLYNLFVSSHLHIEAVSFLSSSAAPVVSCLFSNSSYVSSFLTFPKKILSLFFFFDRSQFGSFLHPFCPSLWSYLLPQADLNPWFCNLQSPFLRFSDSLRVSPQFCLNLSPKFSPFLLTSYIESEVQEFCSVRKIRFCPFNSNPQVYLFFSPFGSWFGWFSIRNVKLGLLNLRLVILICMEQKNRAFDW